MLKAQEFAPETGKVCNQSGGVHVYGVDNVLLTKGVRKKCKH